MSDLSEVFVENRFGPHWEDALKTIHTAGSHKESDPGFPDFDLEKINSSIQNHDESATLRQEKFLHMQNLIGDINKAQQPALGGDLTSVLSNLQGAMKSMMASGTQSSALAAAVVYQDILPSDQVDLLRGYLA